MQHGTPCLERGDANGCDGTRLSAAAVCVSASKHRALSPASNGAENEPSLHLSGFREDRCWLQFAALGEASWSRCDPSTW